jgi:hypothetical protein
VRFWTISAIEFSGATIASFHGAASLSALDSASPVIGKWPSRLRIGANSSLPSGWAMVARAAEDARLGETVFIVASSRKYVRDPGVVLADIKDAINTYCAKGEAQVQGIFIAHGNDAVIALAEEKYNLTLQEFEGSEETGLPEMAWYFQTMNAPNPFHSPSPTAGPASVALLHSV